MEVRDGELTRPIIELDSNKTFQFPSVLLFAVSMFCATALFSHEYNTESLLFLMFWGAMVFGTGSMILRNGRDFVDMPKLNLLTVPREMEP